MNKIEKSKYDLVVIGGGPAGTPVAIEYGKLNKDKKIALVDILGELGGECLFQGCIPSKIMEASSKHVKILDELSEFGIDLKDSNYKLIWEKIKLRKDEILNKRTKAAREVVDTLENVELIKAKASFVDSKSIKLSFEDGTEKIVDFKKAVIATGSKSFIPKYEGNAASKIWNNSDFFAKMPLPKSLAIIGSGAIAIEFTQILSALGVKIYLFARSNKILKNIDSEASEFLLEELKKDRNITLLLGSDIKRIDFDKNFKINYELDNKTDDLECDLVLSGAGRVANIKSLGLENTKVSFTHKGIIVDEFLKTEDKNIFACGDVVEGFPKFAHTAQYGAHTIAQNLFLEHDLFKMKYDINSWVLFSMPNFASAGLSEKEAKDRDIDIIVDKFNFSTEAKSQIENDDFGYLKFIVAKSSKKIIGISILHNEAASMGGEASLIVGKEMKLKELIDTIHPHPTISESFVMLAKKMMGEIMLEKLKNPVVKTLLKLERWI